jgi:hypothetical protein
MRVRRSSRILKVTAGVHRLAYSDYRRALSRIFPYAIYYTMEAQIVLAWKRRTATTRPAVHAAIAGLKELLTF